eukprot:8880437-Pyramimonas_sp.AAC.1
MQRANRRRIRPNGMQPPPCLWINLAQAAGQTRRGRQILRAKSPGIVCRQSAQLRGTPYHT